MQNKNLSFWILTIAVLVFLVVPVLIRDGMFMDGLLYACVAKNLSQGIGTFWYAHYSPTAHALFDQQPPLGFGIQAIFFKLFGTSIYVERFYSFFTLCMGVLLISKIWKQVFREEKSMRDIAWLPVLFWIIIPVCFWAYSNNMLECTMVIFDLLAVFFFLKFFERNFFIHLLLAGFFIFCASLTKGFQGLFPLAAIFFYWIVYRNVSFGRMMAYSFIILFVPVLLYFCVLLNSSAKEGLLAYVNSRVAHSIEAVSTVENRFDLLGRLSQELIASIVISVLLFLFLRKKFPSEKKYFNHAVFFLFIGISASFPLIVTLEQRGFYLVTSLPFYALGIAAFCGSCVAAAIEKINIRTTAFKSFQWASFVLFFGSIIFSGMQIGKFSRDEEMIHDVHLIGKVIPQKTMLGSSTELWQNWSLQEYLIRHYYICMGADMNAEHNYILIDAPEKIPSGIKTEKVNIPTIKYHLYKVVK